MTMKVYTAILGAAVAPLLLGASLVVAQNQSAQNQPAQVEQQTTRQSGQQNAQLGSTQKNQMGMDMSKMMDCCKKMEGRMKDMKMTECPMMNNSSNSEQKPDRSN